MKVTPGLSPWSGRSYFAITASARNVGPKPRRQHVPDKRDVEDINQILSFRRHLLRHLRCPHSSSASRFTAGVPRWGRILGSLRALLLKPRSHQRINLTSIVLDAARISGKHKPMLPDLNHAVPDVKARI